MCVHFKFCRQRSSGTSDLQLLPIVEGLASRTLEAVVGVERMDLCDHHAHLQHDLERAASSQNVCISNTMKS